MLLQFAPLEKGVIEFSPASLKGIHHCVYKVHHFDADFII